MKQLFTFHQTVQGYLHILKDMPCQDSSASYSDPSGAYHIAIIADGHGDRACFRSKIGSREVATAAVNCLKEFADGFMRQDVPEQPETPNAAQPEYRPVQETAPTEEVPAEEAATETAPAEEAIPAEAAPTEETAPTEEAPAEEAPAEEAATPEETPAEEAEQPVYSQIKAAELDEQIESSEPETGYSANLPEGKSVNPPTRNQKWMMRRLIDAICGAWRKKINEHYLQNPPTEEELNGAGAYAKYYREKKHLAHIYGTTLIAALWIDKYLILLQQGDGRCDVVFADGSISQPIPWDDRCHENVTTSMCDDDAQDSMRYCIIDTSRKPVIACFMGSDGVEDSYVDMDGTHMFYRELCCDLLEKGKGIEKYLGDTLPDFSQTGSGDDVSVSGIVDMEAIAAFKDSYRSLSEKYHINEELLRLNSKITSMSRKHGILKKRYEDAKAELSAVAPRLEQLLKTKQSLETKLAMRKSEKESVEKAFDDIRQEGGDVETIEKVMQNTPPISPTPRPTIVNIDVTIVNNAPTYEKKAAETADNVTAHLADDPTLGERLKEDEAPTPAAETVVEQTPAVKQGMDQLVALGAKRIAELIWNNEWRMRHYEELPYLVSEFRERVAKRFNITQREQGTLVAEIAELENKLHALNEEIAALQEQQEPMRTKAVEAEKAFLEYDREYQELNAAYAELQQKMNAL